MTTPIVDFVRSYAERRMLRLHMPGHKGVDQLGVEHWDITEIEGADVLYGAQGIIRESEENAARLFGSARTVYSTEGSSLCIRAMLCLALREARERGVAPLIAAGRNAHKTFMSAAALLDFEVAWLYGEESGDLLSCRITPEYLAGALDAMAQMPIAVYLTSPDYLGNMLDIGALAEICRQRDVLLLVDNAHGAYLRFLPESAHPINLGAHACCDSAHKTLPVLTGGAYLHLAADAPSSFFQNVESAMALFASTSPSYLILQSLDLVNRTLEEGYADRIVAHCARIGRLRAHLAAKGICLLGDEPMKLTVVAKSLGYTGDELANLLRSGEIECEFSDRDFLVMMLSPMLGEDALIRIEQALLSLPTRHPISERPPRAIPAERALSIREATLSPSEELAVELCEGRILASAQLSCPPAVPIVVCGERIDRRAIERMKYYGISHCCVVKE